jgi:long-subunit fatty acid transport protein
MKKVFLLALVLAALASTQAFAQKWYAGGSIGIGFGKEKFGGASSSYHHFSLVPTVGYRLTDKIDVGGTLILETIKGDIDAYGQSGSGKANLFGIAPFAQYHLFKWGNLELLAVGTITFAVASVDVPGFDDSIKLLILEAAPVVQYNLNEQVSIYSSVGGISFTRWWVDSDLSSNEFNIGAFSAPLTIGFIVRF